MNADSDPFNDDEVAKGSVKPADRPSMEAILAEDRAFQADLFAQLARRFGPRDWKPFNGDSGIQGASCASDEYPELDTVGLPNMSFDGAYPKDQWSSVRELVIAVGDEHGFTEIVPLSDRPDSFYFEAFDPKYGGHYGFGIGKNTVFGLSTGCHRWEHTPPPPTPTWVGP